MNTMDTDAYFGRVGWSGALAPDHRTLSGILAAHMAAIPFENLDVLLGRGVRLDLGSVQAKLVHARRGGYCFEHGTLLGAVLERLGFAVARHTARVVIAAPRAQSPRTHMFLTVALPEGSFVLDPGFGALAPRAPVPLAPHTAVHVGSETHWMAREDDVWVLRTRGPDGTIDCWVSTLERDNAVDFELGNHYTATHPQSSFVNRILMRALTPEGRVSVMNRDVTTWHQGKAASHQLADRAALRRLVAAHFGFDLPQIETMRVPSVPEWS